MEMAGGAGDTEPGEIRPLKPCLLLRNNRREQHGVAASCLEELRNKACDILAIDKSLAPVTLVLAEDGTIVDDDDYFLCLPSNTKFVALAGNEKWTYSNSDGGTAWISQESFDADEPDAPGLKWKNVARQLREDLSNIILLSEEDLQVLIDVPCPDLAQELRQSHATVQALQDTLQQVLDQKEEARQSRQLLELYLQALQKEGGVLAAQGEVTADFGEGLDTVDVGVSGEGSLGVALRGQILTTLKGKPAPELSLSSQDLELVTKEDPKALAAALRWDLTKTECVQQACERELALRLEQVRSLRALRSISARRSPRPGEQQSPKRARRGSSST